IVSYVLYLSHVCPLEYDLLFERFLDPNRSEAPDIDIDFCQDRRDLVIQYVKAKYGAESVAQIGTFGTLAAKAALKDGGQVLDDDPLQPRRDAGAVAGLPPGVRGRPADAAVGGHRAEAGGEQPQRRDARGRGGDRQRADHRLRAGAAAAEEG